MTLNLKHISGRRLQDESQEPVLHISDSFLSPHGTIQNHKQILSPSTMPVSDPNISINLEEVASSAQFQALQRRIASHTPVVPQNRLIEQAQREAKERSASSTGYVRSQTQQPKQLALHNLKPTKRGASQVARRSIAKTPNSEVTRSKSVTRNKQPKQERKGRSRDVTAEAEQIITGLRSGSGQIVIQEGKRSSFSSVPASSRIKETVARHPMHPSFGTIEPISQQVQEETQPSPEQNVTLQRELVKDIERPRRNITETLKRTIESKKLQKVGFNNTHTMTMTSNRKDSKIDRIIRANLKQKRAREAAEKLRKLKEVEEQIERKKTLVQTNLIVRQKNAPKGTGLTPTITPQRPTPTKVVAHSFDMNDILAQQQDHERPRSLVQEITRNFREVEQEVERNFGRKLGRVAVSSDGPPKPSKLWNKKHFQFPQVQEGPEEMSSPEFSHGFSPVTRPRIRQTPQFHGEQLFRQNQHSSQANTIVKREITPIYKSSHPQSSYLVKRTHQLHKTNPLEDRASSLRDKLAKLDEFARKVAVSKKPKPTTHHIRKDTLHTSAILESRHMSGRMIATIEVDANDQTEIAPPPKKAAVQTKIKRTLSKKKPQTLEGQRSQKIAVPKEPQVKVLKSLIKLNTKKKIKKVKQVSEKKRVMKKPKGALNTSALTFIRPLDVTTPDHNLRTPSAYKYSPGSLSPPQIQKRIGKKRQRTEQSSGLSHETFNSKPSGMFPPPKPKEQVTKPKQKKPVNSQKAQTQKVQKGATSKREQIEKAHALFKLLKMKEESDDPQVQKALAEYEEILDNLLPQSHAKPKSRPKSGKKEKPAVTKQRKNLKEPSSPAQKKELRQENKEEQETEEVCSEIVTVKRNADKLTPPAPPKVIALPDEDDSTSILDNLNLVLHPSDPKNSAFDSIEYDQEDKQVINNDTVGSEDALELLNNAATIIQRAVRAWLEQKHELQEYVSNAPINPLLYYPDGSPIDGNLGNELEEEEEEAGLEMPEEEMKGKEDAEVDRERLRQAVEYLSMKEQEVGRQLTEEEYVGLLKEAGADDDLIYQVMQLGLEDDDELEQLQNQFAGTDEELQYLDQDLDTAGGQIESEDEFHQRFVRWKSVPEILILPQLVKQDLNQDEERAELMVMQYWQPQEEVKQSGPGSQIDSTGYIQATHSPGMIIHEDQRGHTLEEELKHAIAGVDTEMEEMSPPEIEVHQDTQLHSGSSTLKELNKIIGAREEPSKQGQFTLGYDDLDEESSSRNVVHISMIHEHDLIDHQEDPPRPSPPMMEDEDEDINESNMLVDDSRVDQSLEELVRPTQEHSSEIIPAINEALREQKQGRCVDIDSGPLGSPYINIIEDMEGGAHIPGQDREEAEDEEEEEEEEVYFQDPDHQLDQFDNIDIPEEKDEELRNHKPIQQITPKPQLQIDIVSPDSGESSPSRLKGLPPPVPRPRQLVPALDLRNLSRTQQIAQKEQQMELLKGFHESSEAKSMARSMFERNSFHDFTSSQRGDLQSQRDMVRQMKEDINIEDLEAFHTDKKPVDRILKTRQLSPTAQISKVKEMQEWLEEEKRQNKHSERKKASIGSDWQSAAFLIEQTQQSTERIQKIFSERGVSSHRSRTISNGGSIHARFAHNGQAMDPHSEYNAAGYSTSAARSARVSWRHYSYGVGSNSIPQTVAKQPMNKSKSSELENSPSQQPQVIGKEEAWTSPFNEQQPYLQQEGSISKARHSQPPLTLGGQQILGQSQTQEPKRGLSRTKSQDYLEKRREEKGAQGGDQEKRKPSPQMLQFYKQDKSIEEALDDQIVESIDMQIVEGSGEDQTDPSLLLQFKTDSSKRDKVRQKNLRDILGTSQEQSGDFPIEKEHFADQMYNEMVSGDINDEDLMRSAQKDTDEEGFFSQSNDADRNLIAPGLHSKDDFNKLHSLHDLKKTLEEVRKHTEEQDEEASGEIQDEALPHANLSGPYEDLFGPGGLQSPRTIPEVDLSHLMLTGGSLGSAKMLTTGQLGKLQGHHYHDPKFGSGESLEVLQHLESDPIAIAEIEKQQPEQTEHTKQSTEIQSITPEQKDANISVGVPQSSEDDESAQSLQEIEIQLPAKDGKGNIKEASAGMTVPLPMAQIADLPVDVNSDEDQRHAAEMAIAIHSFGSLEELLQDKTGLREKALQIVSDEIFQAIVNRDLVLPPQLFPNREEEEMLRKRRAVLQEQRRHQENSTPSILRIPGVNTSMQAIAEYLDRLVTEVMEDEQLYKSLELKLKQPFTKDPYTMLEQLQNSEIGSYAHFLSPQYAENSSERIESGIIPKIDPPLSLDIFEKIQRKQKERNAAQEEQKEKEREEESKELQERKEELKQLVEESKVVHDRLIFNCFNQALDEQRPYGNEGEPMPWAVGQKLLECERAQGQIAERTRKIPLKQKLLKAKSRVLMSSAFRAGVFPSMQFVHQGVFDEEQFSTERERRLAAFLANEVLQSEFKWLSYGFQEAQVKIDLGDMILERLVTQAIYILDGIEQNYLEENQTKSIFAQGGFLQQQQQLFQLTLSRSMNEAGDVKRNSGLDNSLGASSGEGGERKKEMGMFDQ